MPAFRYAHDCLRGLVRRTTREPAICHSADIALRAADLGYEPEVLIAALLHDVVEDRSRTLADAARQLEELAGRFGAATAQDVRMLTNVYSLLLGNTRRSLPPTLGFEVTAIARVRHALATQWQQTPGPTRHRFERERQRLLDHFLPSVDLTAGAARASVDPTYSLLAELKLQSYRIFVEDMCDYACAHLSSGALNLDDAVLVVKAVDLIDNLRTSEVASWAALERILLKCEVFLDKTFWIHGLVHERALGDATYIPLYDLVKHSMVQQIEGRRHALSFLADSRFARLANYLAEQTTRLQAKYQVEALVSTIRRLRAELRERNARRRERRGP